MNLKLLLTTAFAAVAMFALAGHASAATTAFHLNAPVVGLSTHDAGVIKVAEYDDEDDDDCDAFDFDCDDDDEDDDDDYDYEDADYDEWDGDFEFSVVL